MGKIIKSVIEMIDEKINEHTKMTHCTATYLVISSELYHRLIEEVFGHTKQLITPDAYSYKGLKIIVSGNHNFIGLCI